MFREDRPDLRSAFRIRLGRFRGMLAFRKRNYFRRFLHAVLSLALLSPLAARMRTYDVLTADVPFKFTIGSHTFHPGRYQFIFVGNGLLALRDDHANVLAMLVTRSVATAGPAPTSKLVFKTQKKQTQLTRIWVENKAQFMEILGEDVAIRSTPPEIVPVSPVPTFSFSDRQDGIRMKQ
ncbi:MAG TPA: hypothetical protein VE133_16380, partial [Candidatus Sulfotelmatobacter sp.]|nr:hypothetical protein [Candidatus Sulfotelmatobacter sp.]